MGYDTREYGYGTRLEQSFPWGLYRGGRAMCSDGTVRALARISETADTFFSIPASVKVRGRTVSGYITTECASGSSVYVDETDPVVVKFVAVQTGANVNMLPRGAWKLTPEAAS